MNPFAAAASETALNAELERIIAIEREIRAAQAEQYRHIEAARQLAAIVEGVTDDSGPTQREFATRAFVSELATLLAAHEVTAGRLVEEASRLTGARVATLDALGSGAASVAQTRTILEVTRDLPADTAAELEAFALERTIMQTNTALKRALRRRRDVIHPEPLGARRERSREERRVCLDAAPDGMAWLGILLEAERGTAILARLDAIAAHTDEVVPDTRTHGQRRSDIAADLLLAGTLDEDARDGLAATGAVKPTFLVTVPVMTLLGHSDEPAELHGYGPIDADTARRLAAHAPSFRRILTNPETGAYLSYGRDSYRVPADLAGYLRVRDGQCRFPGCSRRAERCDIDHTVDWARIGDTADGNLAHLCRKHHRLKHKTGWRMTQLPGGVVRWTSPAGRVYRSLPERPFIPVPPGTSGAPPSNEQATSANPHTPLDDGLILDDEYPLDPPWAA